MTTFKNWRMLLTLLALIGVAFSLAAPVSAQAPEPLAAGDPRMVSGAVLDGTPGGHTWPLYARIDIAGYDGGPVFTNPSNGYYSVLLAEGSTYEFTVSAVREGYVPVTQSVTVPAGNQTVNFAMQVDDVTCEAPGYALVDHWTENFDGVTAPALPANWVSEVVMGYPDAWVTRNSVNVGNGYPPHSGPNLAHFPSNSDIARLRPAAPVDMTALPNHHLTFWMFQDGGYPNEPQALRVKVSTDDGQTWTQVGQDFEYYGSSTGWVKRAVDLGAYASQTSLLFGFESSISYSFSSRKLYIDTVSLGATCDPQAGALLTGSVRDANTGLTLTGAKVQSSLDETFSQATPLDTFLEDGFYSVFAPAGASVAVTASKIPYQPLTQMLTLTAETVASWTFMLPAGILMATPNPANLTLPMNAAGDLTLNLGNMGSASADFKLNEINRPANGSSGLAPLPGPSAGEMLSSFSSGLRQIWGLAYNPLAGDLWIQDLQSLDFNVQDNRLVRFGTDGVNSGDQIVSTFEMDISADLAFNPLTGTLWQTGKNACIYELDLVSRQATGNTICLPGNGPETLAFDPLTDTYLASRVDFNSPSTSFIYRFNPQGEILASGKVNLRIWAMTYNPSTGHLFTVTGSNGIHVIDAATFSQIGFLFNPYDPYNYLHGIDLDCNGSLWASDTGYTQTVYEIASGESGACDWMDIPWLSAAPETGSVPAGGTQPVTLTFDAAGLMPGTYTAQLDISHNTPYDVARLPVEMTVTLAAGYGGMSGVVSGLGRCGGAPTALPGAQVEILAGETVIYTGQTDAAGRYSWASPATGSYTLRASAPGYITISEPFTLTADQMTAKDLTLPADAPCFASSAASLNAAITGNSTSTVEFTLTNSGAGSGEFELIELPAGGITAPLMPMDLLLTEGFEGVSFPPAGWQESSAADPATSWWFAQDYVHHSGELAARAPMPGSNNPLDEWLLTPEFKLHSGNLSFWSEYDGYCKGTPDTCDLNIWLVVGAVGGTDDVFVGRADDAWTASNAWAQSIFDLTPLLPNEPVRIGFQFIRTADYSGITLDDVRLEGAVGVDVPWLSETPVSGEIAPGGSQVIAVTFDPAGLTNGVHEAMLRVRLTPYESIDLPVTLAFSNTAPVAADQTLTTAEDTALTGTLNATDADSDPITYAQGTAPAHGTLEITAATGAFTYTPAADYNGPDSFTFTASDGTLSDTGTVTLTVTPVNDAPLAPVIADVEWQTRVAGSYAIPAFTDADGDTLIYTVTLDDGSALPAWLSFDAATLTFSGTPVNSDAGVYDLKVVASDGRGGTAEVTFTLTVTVNEVKVFLPMITR